MRVYVYLLEGEPLHVYSSLEPIRKKCYEWFDDHRSSFAIEQDFQYWCEDKLYRDPYGEFDYDKAWEGYTEEEFNNGTWGDYAWYDCFLD